MSDVLRDITTKGVNATDIKVLEYLQDGIVPFSDSKTVHPAADLLRKMSIELAALIHKKVM